MMNQSRHNGGVWAFLALVVIFAFPQAASAELTPVNVPPAGASASAPRIASDGAGNIVAVWREIDGDTSSIRAAFRPKGDPWGPSQRISLPAAATEGPEVAMDRSGNAVAVWHSSSGGHTSVVQAAGRPAGGNWSETKDLSLPRGPAFNPEVTLQAGGGA